MSFKEFICIKKGDFFDDRYLVEELFNAGGGMGSLLFVRRKGLSDPKKRVLKYCKENSDEAMRRFRREVRLMQDFKGNNKVMQVIFSNLDHDPPYFVMDYFEDGDLLGLIPELSNDLKAQEELFSSMIDCIAELHSKNVFHRNIKPQNFLRTGKTLVVSDLGLSTEIQSNTVFTRSTMGWGTPGYLPPEFQMPGGFKNADAASDVFMLGKTFYYLLTGRDPTYFAKDGVPASLMVVIERCCAPLKTGRYQDLSALKQSLSAAFDVLLHRVVGSALAVRTLRSISDQLKTSNKYKASEVRRFVDALLMLDMNEKRSLCQELPRELFPILAEEIFAPHHRLFLQAYSEMVEQREYSWSFAETIAKNMQAFFSSDGVEDSVKIFALRMAIQASSAMNRFAAMNTCRAMIKDVDDDGLAQRVHDLIHELPDSFITDIEPATCQAAAIKSALSKYQDKMSVNAGKDED